jgi:glycosyltransferase involved in cell wall biosynthesis
LIDAVDDTAGWLIERPDPDALAAAFDYVAEHPAAARQRGLAGHDLVAERYSEAIVVDAYLDLYREALVHSDR